MINPVSIGAAAVGLGAASGLANTYMQWKNLQYQKDLQKDIFAREDTSIARRVADLKASGLSPVLAAGQGAGTGGTIQTQAPQFENPSTNILNAISLLRMEADISKTKAEEELVRKQIEKIPAEIRNLNSSAFTTYQSGREKKVSADVMEETGVPADSVVGKATNDVYGALKTAKEGIKSGWNSYDSAVGKLVDKVKQSVKYRSDDPVSNKLNDWNRRIPK